jgi:hypothetical protein
MRRAVAMAAAAACATALALALAGCGATNSTKAAAPAESAPPMRTLADIVSSESPSLLAIPGVMAVREGRTDDGDPCILVVVDKVTADLRRRIPTRLQNVPVVIEPVSQTR